ncbi:hypothetical protein BG015_009016 [Linnemannia schmuckeri]|uniref:F-box domain-containing protein n=1 Tax=Linnemannia schmuckeri TaxID=64567 RepID=A0A9P5VA96_9FUNG|nr:hypothetical protein BG015_009016 [Linnemannia schmuckeri]
MTSPSKDPLTLPDIVDYVIPHLNVRQSLARAARVCKAWNAIYIPALWRVVNYNCMDKTVPAFERHGAFVRRLTISYLDDHHLELISHFCPHIESLVLWSNSFASVEKLAPYLKSVRPMLKQLVVNSTELSSEDVVSLLVGDGTGDDAAVGDLALKELKVNCFGKFSMLSWESLMILLKVGSNLETLRWQDVEILVPGDRSGENRIQQLLKAVTATEKASGLEEKDIRLLEDHTKITSLTLRQVVVNDRTLIQLLGKTPGLTYLYYDSRRRITDEALGVLSTLCPELKQLMLLSDNLLPFPTCTQLFRPSAITNRSLNLEVLYLNQCELDDTSLGLLILTQGSTLLEMALCKCLQFTDLRAKAILSGCRRLTILYLYGDHTITLATQEGDEPYNLVADAKRKGWTCHKAMEILEICNVE